MLRPHLGIDVARYGDDESVIMQREGAWVRAAWVGGKLSTMETTGHIVWVKKQLNGEPGLNDFVTIAVDADGLGAGVFDRLVELGHAVGEIRGGLPAIQPEDFVNRRSEWYWNLATASRTATSTSTPATRSWPSSSARSSGR
jgi:hypothetical protein